MTADLQLMEKASYIVVLGWCVLFCFVLKKTKGESQIGFVSCTYLQEALGRFPGEAIIL